MVTAYISEVSYAGTPQSDFVEVAVTSGTDVSGWTLVYYSQLGNQLYTAPFPAPSGTMAGKDIYVLTGQVAADTSVDGMLAGETPTYAGVSAASGDSIQSDDGGTTYYVQSAPNEGTVPCFVLGTRIATPDGEVPVEDLVPGNLVLTADHGPQPLRGQVNNGP